MLFYLSRSCLQGYLLTLKKQSLLRDLFGINEVSGLESWSNAEEAAEVVACVRQLVAGQFSPVGATTASTTASIPATDERRSVLTTAEIGVMAPYRGQVALIRKLLRKHNLGGVNVGTVEDYQGTIYLKTILSGCYAAVPVNN